MDDDELDRALAGDDWYWFRSEDANWLLSFCVERGMSVADARELLKRVENMTRQAENEGARNSGYEW